jgi:hypothetical protein
MNIIVFIIAGIQLVAIIVGGLFPSVFANWMLAAFITLLTIIVQPLLGRFNRKGLVLRLGLLLNMLGITLLLANELTTMYSGYSFAILGQVCFIIGSLEKIDKNKVLARILIAIGSILVSMFLGLVIVPPPPINPALMLMMTLVGLLVYNGASALVDKKDILEVVMKYTLTLSYLFVGLGVIKAAFSATSIIMVLLSCPWHLGLLFMYVGQFLASGHFINTSKNSDDQTARSL